MIDQTDATQTVIVYFRLAGDDLEPMYSLERLLTTAIADAQAGVYDGHELALLDSDDAYLFMCGPDAERLFAAVQPVLESSSLTHGAQATLRYGPPELDDVMERIVTIGA